MKKALLYTLIKHGHKVGKISKKSLIIIGAVFAGLTTLVIIFVIATFVWLFNAFDSPRVQQAHNTTTQSGAQLTNELKIDQFIENSRLNDELLRTKLSELPAQQIPSALNSLRQEVSGLVQSSQLLQTEADKLLNFAL